MRLLLHVCCAPCLTYPLEFLSSKQMHIEGYFYNPNIHPSLEYRKRLNALKAYTQTIQFDMTYSDYSPGEYFASILNADDNERCRYCYQQRLKKTAILARKNNFDAFSTTMLLSPYQKHELLKETAETIANQENIDFFYHDFRSGYARSIEISKQNKIYRQKYCGCIFSELDKNKNKAPELTDPLT